jgi:hypothetical protein
MSEFGFSISGFRPFARGNRGTGLARLLRLAGAIAAVLIFAATAAPSNGRGLTSKVTELDKIPRVRPEYPVPNDPNMLFYIERSNNANTIIYAANLDAHGKLDKNEPVLAFWRRFNTTGQKKPLNFAERMMAYGIKSVQHKEPNGAVSFMIAALPERTLYLGLDANGKPEVLGKTGGRWIKLVYVYIEVDDSGLMPDVKSLDFFGFDKATGKPVREHATPQ